MAPTTVLNPSNHGEKVTKIEWKIVSTGSGLIVGIAVRRVINWAWGALSRSDHEPPLNPADRQITWSEAIAWAAAAGAGVGVARLISSRLAATGWELATGETPPGVDGE